jgi:class 3 adenylate cyclase
VPGAQRDLEVDRCDSTLTPKRDPRRVLAESDHLRIRARARRETLRADVERLQQVRLARAVRADGQDETRLEVEIEPRVRADVPE